jgi:hypothetical protein
MGSVAQTIQNHLKFYLSLQLSLMVNGPVVTNKFDRMWKKLFWPNLSWNLPNKPRNLEQPQDNQCPSRDSGH